ncbi:MAG: DMT family transporter [Candidatus Helarchaeota archaeon]
MVFEKLKGIIKGYILCFIGVFIWSFTEIIVKFLQGEIGPISLSFLRFFIGGMFLLGMIGFRRNSIKNLRDLGTLLRKYKWLFIFGGIFGFGISNLLYFIGLQFTQANVGSALYTTYPIFISIYSVFILNERSNLKLKSIGFLIGITGTTILITNFQINLLIDPQNILGNILIVSAAAIWSIYSVIGKVIFNRANNIKNIEIKYTLISCFLAALPNFVLIGFTSEFNNFLIYTWEEWIIILILGTTSTALSIYLFFKGVQKIEVSKGISLALFKPVIATIFSFIILFEVPTLALLIAFPLIIIAVLLINNPFKKSLN